MSLESKSSASIAELKSGDRQVIPATGPIIHMVWQAALPDRKLLSISDSFTALLGYTLADFESGRVSLHSITHPADLASVDQGIAYHLQHSDTEWSQVYRMIGRDGRVHWFRDWNRFESQEDHPPGVTHTVALEITESRERERRYQTIVEAAQEGIWITDRDNRTTFANASMARMLGCPRAEMVGASFLSFMDDAARRRVEQYLQRRREGVLEQHEIRFLRKDGTPLWTLVDTSVLLDDDGRYQGALHMVTDITARRSAEESRRTLETRVQRAEKSESLSLMANGIAHDFNNLIAAIEGHLELALDGIGADHPERSCLTSAREATRRASALCRRILAYAGGAASKRRHTTIEDVLASMNPGPAQLMPGNIRLAVEAGENLPPVDIDADQLREVLTDILNNAVEAIGTRDGQIRLRTYTRPYKTEELKTSWQEENLPGGEYLGIEITDSGCGMSVDTLRRIFDPFYTTKFAGRGLSLPAALGVIRTHRGAIQVESRPAHGTTVRILLPAARNNTPAMARHTHPGVMSSATRDVVLVVDDEPSVRDVTSLMLKRAGYTPAVCTDGAEAVELFARQHRDIRCILLDMVMPGMNGDEAMRRFHEIDPSVPVIIISGYSLPEIHKRFGSLQIPHFLQKPYTMRGLHDALTQVLNAKSAP